MCPGNDGSLAQDFIQKLPNLTVYLPGGFFRFLGFFADVGCGWIVTLKLPADDTHPPMTDTYVFPRWGHGTHTSSLCLAVSFTVGRDPSGLCALWGWMGVSGCLFTLALGSPAIVIPVWRILPRKTCEDTSSRETHQATHLAQVNVNP